MTRWTTSALFLPKAVGNSGDTLTGGRKRKPADGLAAESMGFLSKNTGWMDADGDQSFS
jgi:hypothetical protein